MSILNPPSNPSTGAIYTGTNGVVYSFDGIKWIIQSTNGPLGPSGVSGPSGVAGPSGTNGAQGIQGVQGLQGSSVQGVQGAQGIQGSGIQGTQGANGSNGSQGLQGTQGLQGLQGSGSQGVQGATGANGSNGVQGPLGPTGVQGTQGSTGANGSNGSQGVQGVQGASGNNGTSGPTGPSGPGALSSLNYVQVLGNTSSPPVVATSGTILSLTITTSGGPVQLVGTGDANNTSAAFFGTVQWYRGATALGNQQFFESNGANENQSVTQVFIDNPTAGTYTYYWKMPRSSAAITWGESTTAPVISATELQGVLGATGPQGPSGPSGSQGTQGATGPTGPMGLFTATGNIVGTLTNVTLVAGSYNYTFDNTGVLTLPAQGTGSSNEGGEIDFGKAPNSTLTGATVVFDQYIDRFRFFESGGTNRGAYIDLSIAAAGVGTLLNNRASGFVNAGVDVTLGNLKARIPTSGNRSLQISTVSGTYSVYGTNLWYAGSTPGGSYIDGATPLSVTTTPTYLRGGNNFSASGYMDTWTIMDTSAGIAWRITCIIGVSYANNMISIERLI